MRYLIVILLLLPTLAWAAEKEKYSLKCELISGGHCKKTCPESDVKLRQVEALGGERKGTIADVVCNEYGKDYLCCVEKDKLMK